MTVHKDHAIAARFNSKSRPPRFRLDLRLLAGAGARTRSCLRVPKEKFRLLKAKAI